MSRVAISVVANCTALTFNFSAKILNKSKNETFGRKQYCGYRDTTALQTHRDNSIQDCRAVTPWQPKNTSNLEHNDFEYQCNINRKKTLHCCFNIY